MSLALAAIVLLAASSFGCSAVMALSGEEDPNLSTCRVGATREQVEVEVGLPVSVWENAEGDTTCLYEYEIGDEPSVGRAMAHIGLDVLTIGIWEVVGTPVEAIQGETYQLTVTYDEDGKVTSIHSNPKP